MPKHDELDVTDIIPHELFLPEKEDDPPIGAPVLKCLSITRLKPFHESAGRSFPIEEFPDVDAIRARFGGGVFRVQGRDERKRVLASREVTIPGRPKLPEDDEPKAPPAAPPAPAPVATTADHALTEAVRGLGETMRGMMARQDEQTKVMVAMAQDHARGMVDAMGKTYSTMLEALTRSPAVAPTSGADEFRAGLSLGQTIAETMIDKLKPAEGAEAAGDDLKSIGSIVETIAKLRYDTKS